MKPITQSSFTSVFPLRIFEQILDAGCPGSHWTKLHYHFTGLNDIRPRAGDFSTPWNATSVYKLPWPDFSRAESADLETLMDRRANEIYQQACASNRQMMVLWSGGIDSTALLVALLRNIPRNEQADLITVALNTDSVTENFTFYRNHISGALPVVHKQTIDVTDELLSSHILLSGDPADALFGCGVRKFRSLHGDDRFLLPFRSNMDLLLGCAGNHHPDTWHWLIEKVLDNLQQVNLEQVVSIADLFWFMHMNLRYEGTFWRSLFGSSLRKDHARALDPLLIRQHQQSVFYYTDYFQRWSYTNLHRLFHQGITSHKWELKQYIYQFDRNESYRATKGQTPSAVLHLHKDLIDDPWRLPVYYDDRWKGYCCSDRSVYDQVLDCLTSYKG